MANPLAAFLTLVMIGSAAMSQPAWAQKGVVTKTGQVRIVYMEPKNAELQPIYAQLKESQILEKFQQFMRPLRLPGPLLLEFVDCNGKVNAWYQKQTVMVCYDFVAEMAHAAPKETTKSGVTPHDAVIGPLVQIFFHEVAHAVFDMLKLPVFGREEDAADLVAAYMLVRLGKEEARRMIGGVALMYARQTKEQNEKLNAYWSAHSLPAQRFYNFVCIGYGAYPDVFEAVSKDYLPEARAKNCANEYRQIAYAFKTLIGPHLDSKLLKKQKGLDLGAPD